MKTPLICAEGWDILIVNTPEELARHVEAVDVTDGIYECFDSDGVVLQLSVMPCDRVCVEEAVPRRVELERLVARLRESLGKGRRPIESAGLGLPELIEAVRRRE